MSTADGALVLIQQTNSVPLGEFCSRHFPVDGLTLLKWVKEELFKYCKFIQSPKTDLCINSRIHKYYRDTFRNSANLQGVRAATEEEVGIAQEDYLDRLWEYVTTKEGIVNKGLALRRTGIYTVMQNRCMGKSNRKKDSDNDASFY
jgi:hypothetical protein